MRHSKISASGAAGRALAVPTAFAVLAGAFAFPAAANTITSAAFNVAYAKDTGPVRLTVATPTGVKCVKITGAHQGFQTNNPGNKTSWTFDYTAGTGDGVKEVTAAAFTNTTCATATGSTQNASYVLDNTGPVPTGTRTPAANTAGWNNANVTLNWSAEDAGSGVKPSTPTNPNPNPLSDAVTTETSLTGVTKSSTAVDNLGNSGSGSLVVKLDKTLPAIDTTRTAANGAGWNDTNVTVGFTCSDALSGIKTCPAPQTLSSEGASQQASGTAVDVADNTRTATVSNINIDKTAPTLTGAPTSANAGSNGWYTGDVTVVWTANDLVSGIPAGATPANSTIGGEGQDLKASATVLDRAGNSRTADSLAVRIDRTAPNTVATAPTSWNNTDQTVLLAASDAGSGVATTRYTVNGGEEQSGGRVALTSEGVHTVRYWSVDTAGNTEAAKTVEVKIDKTPPTIRHEQSPAANDNGWNRDDVTITFICSDGGGSGLQSCTEPTPVRTEGLNQLVTGTAVDRAGNSVDDPTRVSIDKTAPRISASADRAANAAGWYKNDVRVTFTCSDSLSGIPAVDGCTTPADLGEGASQSASGTARDAADNTATTSVTGINIDKTAPTLAGAARTRPNGHGWYSGDVTVDWTCADQAGLSGLAGNCPAASTVTGEGSALSTSASVTDRADNTTETVFAGLKIDRHAPDTTVSVPMARTSGWYGDSVLVTLAPQDALSTVDKTYYAIGTGVPQEYTEPFTLSTLGRSTITFWSVDKADNVEDRTAPGHSIEVKIDGVDPTITSTRNPGANTFGWNNAPVTVGFECNDAHSGIAGCSGGQTLSEDTTGEGTFVTGNASDNAGNGSELRVGPVKIDSLPPTLTGAATTEPNAADWYKGDVTIAWSAEDGLSGINAATVPANSPITGEGANLGAGPVTVADQAGNMKTTSVSGIRIDRTAPGIAGAPTTVANTAGWYNRPVTVRFTCTDPLSGVASCPSDEQVETNGATQSVTSGVATDRAGNEAAGRTVGGINLDALAPTTNAEIECTGNNRYCRTTAKVKLSATDQALLSGVKGIHYQVNDGAWTFSTGSAKDVNVPLSGNGTATVLFKSEDVAGNVETQDGVTLKYDTIAPVVTGSRDPAANGAGWNKTDVTVSFTATDTSDGSGVDEKTVTAPTPITTETSGRQVAGQAADMAGNVGTDTVLVKLDKTEPTISGAATTQPNSNGWYASPVRVQFTCSDALSTIAVCPAAVTVTNDGSGQAAEGTARDVAGNTKDDRVAGINIDGAAPTLAVTGVAKDSIYTLGAVPVAGCTAVDNGPSGLDGTCSITVTGGSGSGVGTYNYSASVKDLAGNVTTATGSYTVRYPVVTYSTSFWLQPINDTAHTTGQTTSVFKAGSTVPAKFRIVGKDGKSIQTNTPPQWMTPAKGSATTASVDEAVYAEPATSGSTFIWNAAEQLYQFNWASPKNGAGNFWRIGVRLDDGTFQAVNIGLR